MLGWQSGRGRNPIHQLVQVTAPDAGLSAKRVPGAEFLRFSLDPQQPAHLSLWGQEPSCFTPVLVSLLSSVQFQALWKVPCAVLKAGLVPITDWLLPEASSLLLLVE